MKIVILAAGNGTRLGNPLPKPLVKLKNGKSILQQQIDNITRYFDQHAITLVVGFQKNLIIESFPNMLFVHNDSYHQNNTSKSLLKALKTNREESVLWLNGDVVFDAEMLGHLKPLIEADQSFMCVNNHDVGEEEIKYTLDDEGFIKSLSKKVAGAAGEAVGINFVSRNDYNILLSYLERCDDQDYFERGIELAIEHNDLQIQALDISRFRCIEVDFAEDLERANKLFDSA